MCSESPRSVSVERAEEILAAPGPFLTRVCVSHTTSLEDIEIMLDVKLVSEVYATPDFLTTVGGQAAEARSAGLVLSFRPASSLGIETFNEFSNQWRPVSASGTFAVVATLPE